MAFQQNSGNFSNNNGEKKKTNFRVGKIGTQDGRLNLTLWKSDKGNLFVVMSIENAVGKDPTNGRIMYEQKMPNELPAVYMNRDVAFSFLRIINRQKDSEQPTINGTIQIGKDGKVTFQPDNGTIKMTIENSKTTPRTMTFDTMTMSDIRIINGWGPFQKILEKLVDRMVYDRFDPDEFNINANSSTDEEEPF